MAIDWNLVLAAATVLMAGGTFYLAHLTRKLAKETAGATKQAERHHQENIRETQERVQMARHLLWESIVVLACNCVDAISNLLQKYQVDAWGKFLSSHTPSDFDIPIDGLAVVPLHQVGNPELIVAVLELRGIMGRITSHLDDVRANKGVMPFSPDLVRAQKTPVFNAFASIMRVVKGATVETESEIAHRTSRL
jgi:hypothetical protein